MPQRTDYDAIIIGAGPNGLAAAIELARHDLQVLVLEAAGTVGGGCRTQPLTGPSFRHDVCSAIHPLAYASPYLSTLPLTEHGLEWIKPSVALAHPLAEDRCAALSESIAVSAESLDEDASRYSKFITPLVSAWPKLAADFLGPPKLPRHPFAGIRFGLRALRSAQGIADRFKSDEARALIAGMAAHSGLALDQPATAAVALVLTILAHRTGWPFPRGGAQAIVDSMASYFRELGGEIRTNVAVSSLNDLAPAQAYLCDVTPRQLLELAGNRVPETYRHELLEFQYGCGVFKIDYALSEPTPFSNNACRCAGTVHLGGTFEEISASEEAVNDDKHPERPFVLFAQHSVFDDTRAPNGKHTAWAYCHVPRGSLLDMTKAIENQIERFAPGFRDIILARHTMNTRDMQKYNANYIGGDINGGRQDWRQMLTRPTISLNPYVTPMDGVFICSSSTPPGGGVHGMCGYHAARAAIKRHFS